MNTTEMARPKTICKNTSALQVSLESANAGAYECARPTQYEPNRAPICFEVGDRVDRATTQVNIA